MCLQPKGPVDLILFMGQSNMAGRGVRTAAHPQAAPQLLPGAGYEYRAVSDPESLHVLREPFGATEDRPGGIDDLRMKSGSLVTAFVNSWFLLTGTPVVGVSASKGGSRMVEWLPGSRYLTDAVGRLQSARNFLHQIGLTIRQCLMLWCQGESDGDVATPPSVYKREFEQMFAFMRQAGVDDCLLIQIGCYNGNNPAIDYAPIRQAQQELCDKLPHLHLVSTSFAGMKAHGLMKDDFHYFQQAYNEVGIEAARNAVHILELSAQ